MAIRIQREVGGNLAELLTTVAATLRERERLRRQVQVLSAEGRLSALDPRRCCPSLFALYLLAGRARVPQAARDRRRSAGCMIGVGVVLLVVGALLDAQGRQGGGLTWTRPCSSLLGLAAIFVGARRSRSSTVGAITAERQQVGRSLAAVEAIQTPRRRRCSQELDQPVRRAGRRAR